MKIFIKAELKFVVFIVQKVLTLIDQHAMFYVCMVSKFSYTPAIAPYRQLMLHFSNNNDKNDDDDYIENI